MGDLERKELYSDISDCLDNIEVIIDNCDVDVEDDEELCEISDLLERIRTITGV